MNIVRCREPPVGGGLKTQNGRFPCKIALRLKKVCYKLFTALHVMQTRYCDENSVRPSVRLSVCPSVRHTREL